MRILAELVALESDDSISELEGMLELVPLEKKKSDKSAQEIDILELEPLHPAAKSPKSSGEDDFDLALENFTEASKIKPKNHTIKFRLSRLYNILAEENKENGEIKLMNKNFTEGKKYAKQCLKLKNTHGGAYYELGVAELNLCNKSSSLKALKKAAKYDRKYRSAVRKIIKKIDSIMNHCE